MANGRLRGILLGVGVAIAATAGHAQEEKVVHVYNWSDYITPEVIKAFTAETGIRVDYSEYDSNETLEAKLMVGRSGYDLVFPSAAPYFAKQIQARIYRPLDRSKIPNATGVDPEIMRILETADPGNRHGLPYLMAGTGIGYNVEQVRRMLPDAPIGSLAMIFDPRVVAKLQSCGVIVLDAAEEVLPAALAYLGRDPTSTAKADLDEATKVVMAVRKHYRYLHSSTYINDLANGAICVALGYAGDLVQARNRAREAGQGVEVGIFLPREGAAFNIDVMAIPADAPHPENAHRFADFLLRPGIIAQITASVGYANAISASKSLIPRDVLTDPVIYPPADVRFYAIPLATAEFERLRTRAWTRIRRGR